MILGIDTSNYTTSAALMSLKGKLIAEDRRLLEVEKGKRGLRQSKAVFQHINQLPEVIDNVINKEKEKEITKIVVSTRPRPDKNSYMPVFLVGQSQAESLASLLDIPLIKVSHQEGHLMAGKWSSQLKSSHFLGVHISGGTTELLKATCAEDRPGFTVEVLGESQDLHAGQFVDRVGVKLGLQFPAGPALEKLAKKGEEGAVTIPSSVKGYQISFSGPCSAAMRLIERGKNKEDIALGVLKSITKSLEEVLKKAIKEEGLTDVLIVGGVSANQYIRAKLRKELETPAVGGRLYFAEPRFSSDQAVGAAALGVSSID